MPIHGRQPKLMPLDQARACAHAALALAGDQDEGYLAEARQAPAALVSHWPAWVARAGAIAVPDGCCLWCEPQRDPRETFPSQLILNLPKRKYVVEILDAMRGTWISRETLGGGMIVTGLPYTAGTLLVRARVAVEAVAAEAGEAPSAVPTSAT